MFNGTDKKRKKHLLPAGIICRFWGSFSRTTDRDRPIQAEVAPRVAGPRSQ